jgi:hypothetical protein
MPRFKAIVEIEINASDEDVVDDLIHAVWQEGDPKDALDATLWTTSVVES